MAAMFIYSERDMLLVNVDEITYVRALDERDLDPRTNQLRSGIPNTAATELHLRRGGTHYLHESIEDFMQRLRQAMDVVAVEA